MAKASVASSQQADFDVHLIDEGNHVKLGNGIVEVTLSKPQGIVIGIRYAALDNLLEALNTQINRGYWDLNWSLPNGSGIFDVIIGEDYNVIDSNPEKVEVSFVRKYNPSRKETMVPLDIDKRFVLLRGDAGFYSYGIYEHSSEWMDFDLIQTRIAFKLRKDKFQYMAMDDSKQRVMPSPDDRLPDRCQQLCYPEAVLLLKPENPMLEGEVDDKYQYSCENKINRLHGWLSMDPLIGFWVITPSFEFRNGGITKQNLTSHVGPTSLSVFHSGHYAGTSLYAQFRNGESWKKVFGPVRVYLNSAQGTPFESDLWEDAKRQLLVETQAWPYSWPSSKDYLKGEERGIVKGRLQVQDRFVSTNLIPATFAVLGLAVPGEVGSWQTESKGYQFWSEADADGYFTISNIRPGTYNLFGWVPNILGDFKKDGIINVQPGALDLGEIIYEPPRDGPTLWEIGIPDRTARSFFIPEPNPEYINKLFINHPERYRQYGLWLQYSENYPDGDLIYTIGKSDPSRDWFFAQVCRIKDGALQPTTWTIVFQLDEVSKKGIYKLRIALASANVANLQVRVNDASTTSAPLLETKELGGDNAIARHGIHGLYHLFSVDIPYELLQIGENTVYLTQANTKNCLVGVMYDYLRLEEPEII